MNPFLPLASLATVLALSSPVVAQSNDYLLEIDSARATIGYQIETNLFGLCVPLLGTDQPMTGQINMELTGGVLPIATGKFDGGVIHCPSLLSAIVPNVLRHLPPLAIIDFENLKLQPNSLTFPVDSSNGFSVHNDLVVVDGDLVVRLLGQLPVRIPLIGMTSDTVRSFGAIEVESDGIRVMRVLGNRLIIDVPLLNLSVNLALRGEINARMSFPTPQNLCDTTPNSVGIGALLDVQGTLSVSRDDCLLRVVGLPSNAHGIAIMGTVQANVLFGNGNLCIGGSLVRLPAVQADVSGVVLIDPNLAGLNVQAGVSKLVQFYYRDNQAGGARIDLSNALRLNFCP